MQFNLEKMQSNVKSIVHLRMIRRFDCTIAGNTLRLVELSDGTIKNSVQVAKSEYFRKF